MARAFFQVHQCQPLNGRSDEFDALRGKNKGVRRETAAQDVLMHRPVAQLALGVWDGPHTTGFVSKNKGGHQVADGFLPRENVLCVSAKDFRRGIICTSRNTFLGIGRGAQSEGARLH